jgi:transposase
MRFDLSDEEWAILGPLMPKSRKSARADDRKIMNAIFYVLRTGMPWRDLPERYGPYTTAYNRFNRWSRRGIWKRIFDTLASKSRDSLYLIDSTIVKAHRAASGAQNAWPAPSASGFCIWHKQSAQTYPAFRLCRWPRWRSARSAPHKGDGIEVPFCALGLQNTDRLSGHLPLNHPQTSWIGRQRKPIGRGSGCDCSRLKGCTVPQERPDDARHLGGERNNYRIGMSSRE